MGPTLAVVTCAPPLRAGARMGITRTSVRHNLFRDTNSLAERTMKRFLAVILGMYLTVFGENFAFADQISGGIERAEGERLAQSIAHYSRARSLLAAAIREFDKGRALADPSALINPEQWRDT